MIDKISYRNKLFIVHCQTKVHNCKYSYLIDVSLFYSYRFLLSGSRWLPALLWGSWIHSMMSKYIFSLISSNPRALSSANNSIRVSLLLTSKESVYLYNSKSIFGMNFTVHVKNASKKVEYLFPYNTILWLSFLCKPICLALSKCRRICPLKSEVFRCTLS